MHRLCVPACSVRDLQQRSWRKDARTGVCNVRAHLRAPRIVIVPERARSVIETSQDRQYCRQ
jgi:hypothetical protein